MNLYKVAVVGGLGLVGTSLIKILIDEKFPISELIVYGSEDGEAIIENIEYHIRKLDDKSIESFDFVFFCSNEAVSEQYAEKFASLGAYVIDNSSYFRLKDNIPLVVPEINASDLLNGSKIIANPNCTTIMILLALNPLLDKYKLERFYASTYQATSGAGKEGLNQYICEKVHLDYKNKVLPNKLLEKSSIFDNLIPIVDVLLDSGYTSEEMKVRLESKKILHLDKLEISTTAVRVPTSIGHGASIFAIFEEKVNVEEAIRLFGEAAYLRVYNDPHYPTLSSVRGTPYVGVGRIRRDLDCEYTLNFFVTSDNLIRGASYNAYKIALKLVEYNK